MKKFIILPALLIVSAIVAHAQTAGKTTGNPIGGIIVKGTVAQPVNNATPAPAAGITNNPLYESKGTAGVNPISSDRAMTTGSPIGGIVVKGGQNPRPQQAESAPVKPGTDNSKSISEKGIK